MASKLRITHLEQILAAKNSLIRVLTSENESLKQEIERLRKENYELKSDIRAMADMQDGF